MSWRLSDDPDALGVAAARIEEVLGIPAAHVEKDFWVTEVLRAVAAHASAEAVTVVFKGGTSLSKAHGLIARFSEDVDLIVVTPGESKGAADRCLKRIAAAVEAAVGVEGIVDQRSATKGQKRTVSYDYPGQHDASGLKRGVQLELGARGGTLPAQPMGIGSLVAQHGPAAGIAPDFQEAARFEFRVLDPLRTLVEKLMILHHAAVAGDGAEQARHARHYYDVWCLLNDEATRGRFDEWPCDALAREVETFTAAAGLETSPRPQGGFGQSRAFVEPTASAREAYEEQVIGELLWNGSHHPTFDECRAAVMDRAEIL